MSPADPFCLKNHALNFNLKKWNPGLCIFNHRAKRKHNPQMFTTLNWMYLSSVIFVSQGETSLSSLSFLHLFFYCFPKTLFPHIICSLSHPGSQFEEALSLHTFVEGASLLLETVMSQQEHRVGTQETSVALPKSPHLSEPQFSPNLNFLSSV